MQTGPLHPNEEELIQKLKTDLNDLHLDWEGLLQTHSLSSDPHFLQKVSGHIQKLEQDTRKALETRHEIRSKAKILHFLLTTPWGAPFVTDSTLLDAANTLIQEGQPQKSTLAKMLTQFVQYGDKVDTQLFKIFDDISEELAE